MQIERITTARKKPKEGQDDCPDAIATGAHEFLNELIGRAHRQETRLRWERMDADNKREDRTRSTSK
jgi:hypothetical protein